VSGTGWGKYGMFLLSPQIGLATGETEHDSPKENETATPYQYAVTLSRYGIKTAVTPATHSAIYQFTFPASDSAHLLLDISHNITDIATSMKNKTPAFIDGNVSFTNKENTELKGYGNYIGGFSNGAYKVYFCMRLSKAPAKVGTWLNDRVADGKAKSQSAGSGERFGAYVQYSTKENEVLYVKIGVSLKSIEQATAWLDEEITGWDYDQVKQTAVNSWTKELGKIKVEGGTETEKQIFYTACYHASIMPRDRTNDFVGYEVTINP
jgi:putative alpha-1,2-mannosidase